MGNERQAVERKEEKSKRNEETWVKLSKSVTIECSSVIPVVHPLSSTSIQDVAKLYLADTCIHETSIHFPYSTTQLLSRLCGNTKLIMDRH